MQSAQHQLLGAEVSYYTAKVRAYLRWKQIPFRELAATREIYRDVIVPRTGVRFIPVLITDDDVAVQDSSHIIDLLEQRYSAVNIVPETPAQRLVALLLETYADEWLLLPAMHYRWNIAENREFAMLEFGRLSIPAASLEEQRALGEKLAGPFAGALPALGVHAATAPAIEASYHELLEELSNHSPPEAADPLPRAIGRQHFRLGNVTAERAVYPFNAYRWQRCADHYAELGAASRVGVDQLLDRTGGRALLGTAIPRRLERTHNQLRFAR